MSEGAVKLVAIAYYPVKSLPGHAISSVTLKPGRGLPDDRIWALASGTQPVAPNGSWTPCGAFERLTIRPGMAAWTGEIGAGQRPTLKGPTGEILAFDDEGWPIGPVPAPFGPDIRLVHGRDGYWDHADGTVSIINLNTVDEIERMVGTPVDPARFRANFYVRAKPWSEFGWLGRTLSFEGVKLDVIRPIDRCRATSVRPGTDVIDLNMPAQLMRHFGHMYCGVYATVVNGGDVSIQSHGHVAGQFTSDKLVKAAQQETAPSLDAWPRQAEVVEVIEEAEGVRSVWLRDPLAILGSLKSYEAAQYIRLHALDGRSTWRIYTISAVNGDLLRITVKRGDGAGSGVVHELKVGDDLTISGPGGSLRLPDGTAPLIFLSAGVGITPIIAMLRTIGTACPSKTVDVIHVSRTREGAALWDEVRTITENLVNGHAHLWTTDAEGGDHFGRPDLAIISEQAATSDATVVMCGPDGFMTAARAALEKAGVPDSSVISEAFISPDIETHLRAPSASGPFTVKFSTSGIAAEWTAADGTLLDLAEANGIVVPSHCRAGQCGTCRVSVRSGKAEKLIGMPTDAQTVLTCCSVPQGTLDLAL